MAMVDIDTFSPALHGLSSSYTVLELSDDKPLNFILGFDTSGKYAVVTKLVPDENADCNVEGRKLSVGDVLFSINEHGTLDDDISDILLFLDTLKECGLNRKLTFLDPTRVSEASHLQAKSQNKDLLGFSRDLDYLLGEKVYNNANLNSTAQRDLEWVAYLKHIGGPDNLKPAGNFEPSSELKYMVRRGIPAAFRSLIWQKVSLSSIHRLSYPSDYYSDLLAKSHEINKKVADDIEKDVRRTFPEHDYFDRGIGGDGLRRVLTSYALHNPSVGYCQSLNFITGMMLLFLQEEDAFWLLLTVVDTLLPEDCYSKSMIGTHVDQLVFAHIIETSLPKLQTALTETQMDLSLVTVPWFMCLFVNTLRPEVTLRVWDMFLCEGCKVLFRISAALLKKNESALVAASMRDSVELFMEMKSIGRSELDADALIAMAYKSYTPPTSKQRSIFTSRSASNLAASSRRGLVDPPARKYNEFSQVPLDLIGMGVAHTGPVISPVTSSKSTEASPLSSLSPRSPPDFDDESKIGETGAKEVISQESEGRIALTESTSQKNEPRTGLPGVKEVICPIAQKSGVREVMSQKSLRGSKETTKNKSFLGIKTDISYYEKKIVLDPAPFPRSCLSLCQVQAAAAEMLKAPVGPLSKVQEECDEMKNSNSDCCFDKSAASAMLQLGRSAFKPNCISIEGKNAATAASTYPTGDDTSPSSVMDLNSPFSDPSLGSKLDLPAPSVPMWSAGSAAAAYQKKVKARSTTSLINMILYSNATSSQSNDQYRNFKRADIDRLREAFRPIVMERFLSLERLHTTRHGQENTSSESPQL